MSQGGRPRALDETKRREICALVTAGVGIHRAAQYVGCAHSTICREAQRDESFRQQLRRAKATRLLSPLQAMRQAAQTNWRAAAWMLERSDPEQFGRRQRNAFGAKELRMLADDLMRIFSKAISDPFLHEEVTEQVRATINYAMRHAWDTRRSGSPLNQAMKFFAKKNAAKEPWELFDRAGDDLARARPGRSTEKSSFAKVDEPNFAKPTLSEPASNERTPYFPDSPSSNGSYQG